ncbi:unnamed protein product [Heterosigma akashiwo]
MDGRTPNEMRYIKLNFGRRECESYVEVQLGQTRVSALVTADIVAPYPDRPAEGFLFFNVELSQMAAPSIEGGRASILTVELTRLVERCVRDSRALDQEGLCLVAGQKVWSIRLGPRMAQPRAPWTSDRAGRHGRAAALPLPGDHRGRRRRGRPGRRGAAPGRRAAPAAAGAAPRAAHADRGPAGRGQVRAGGPHGPRGGGERRPRQLRPERAPRAVRAAQDGRHAYGP